MLTTQEHLPVVDLDQLTYDHAKRRLTGPRRTEEIARLHEWFGTWTLLALFLCCKKEHNRVVVDEERIIKDLAHYERGDEPPGYVVIALVRLDTYHSSRELVTIGA